MALNANNISITHPNLLSEWSPKNTLQPNDVSFGSDKKVLWSCVLNHEWTASISNRARLGTGCPYCSGNLALAGFNDLQTVNPELAKSWSKNNVLGSHEVLPKAKAKYLWACGLGHEWDESPHARSSRIDSCPICVGKRVLTGFNDLLTTDPLLASSWSPQNSLNPTEVSRGSDKKVFWVCNLEHEWEARISSRITGSGCPYCAGSSVLKGHNDLATLRPDIAAQWSAMNTLFPDEVTVHSGKKAYWDCPNGHYWRAAIASRTGKSSGCLICSGNQVLVGFNDLATLRPAIAKEWSGENHLLPTEVVLTANKRIHWVCQEKGHKWTTSLSNRTFSNTGCPDCLVSKTEAAFMASFTKQTGFDFVSANIPLVRDLYTNKRAQIDGLCEELKIAVEYDGQWSHGNTVRHGQAGDGEHRLRRDAATAEALLNAGYRVIRIREHSTKGKLLHVEINVNNLANREFADNLFQVTYKSFGKVGERDEIDDLVKMVTDTKQRWFNL